MKLLRFYHMQASQYCSTVAGQNNKENKIYLQLSEFEYSSALYI